MTVHCYRTRGMDCSISSIFHSRRQENNFIARNLLPQICIKLIPNHYKLLNIQKQIFKPRNQTVGRRKYQTTMTKNGKSKKSRETNGIHKGRDPISTERKTNSDTPTGNGPKDVKSLDRSGTNHVLRHIFRQLVCQPNCYNGKEGTNI